MAVTNPLPYHHPHGSLGHSSYFSQPYPTSRPSSQDYNTSARPSHYNSRRHATSPLQSPRPTMPTSRDSYSSQLAEASARPSLPSISNLLVIADGDTSSPGRNAHRPQTSSPQYTVNRPPSSSLPMQSPQSSYTSSLKSSQLPPSTSRNMSVLDVINTDSPRSVGTSASSPLLRVTSIINSVEPTDRSANYSSRDYVDSPSQSSPSIGEARYTTSPYATSPGASSTASYYQVSEASFSSAQNNNHPFHPQPHHSRSHSHGQHVAHPSHASSGAPTSVPGQTASESNSSTYQCEPMWEHHHYMNGSAQAVLPQSHNRYVCPTCSKAFSRPSSLKIHSHSHTGEKPFRCPHSGCDKSFSVRSNMKRHERGCHVGSGGAGGV